MLRKALRPSLTVVGVLFLALVLRLAVVLWLSDTVPYTDYFYYHEAGRMQAEDWTFFLKRDTVEKFAKLNWWPPGYPVFLSAIYRLVGPDFRVAIFVQVLMGTLVCGLVYAIGRRAASHRAGLVAAALVVVNPTYVFTTNLVASENLFAVWLALGLWLAGRPANASGASAGQSPGLLRGQRATGVVFALGTLTRAVGLMLPVVTALWLRRHSPSRQAWRSACLGLLGAYALTLGPWTLRNALVTGSPVLVCFGGGLNFYFGHNDVQVGYREVSKTPMTGLGDTAAIDRMGLRLGLQNLAQNPLGFVTRGVRKIGALFASPGYALHANNAILVPDYKSDPSFEAEAKAILAKQRKKDAYLDGILTTLAAVHSYLLLAAALAACILWWRRLPGELRLSAWISIYWIAAHVVFWAQPRFRYPMEIPLSLLAGFALSRLGRRSAPQA